MPNNLTHASIDEAIERAADGDPRLESLLQVGYGRILHRSLRRDASDTFDEDSLGHVRDWLLAAIVTDASWLSNVDERGRPKKLMKLGTVAACLKEADKAMLRANQQLQGTTLDSEDEAFEYGLADGYWVVRLRTAKALDLESVRMGHCIGNGAYDRYLETDAATFLSVRDRSGRPHVTIHVSPHQLIFDGVDDPIFEEGSRVRARKEAGPHITEIKGKGNSAIHERHARRLLPFLNDQGMIGSVPNLARDETGRWLAIDELRPGMRLSGNMSIESTTRLPDDLFVDGFVQFRGQHTPIPRNLVSTKAIEIRDHAPMMELPSGLRAPSVRIRNTSLSRLDGSIIDCIALDYAPSTETDCEVKVTCHQKSVCVRKAKSVSFDKNISLERLIVKDVDRFEPQDDLVVYGFLSLRGDLIRRLPIGLRDARHLILSRSKVVLDHHSRHEIVHLDDCDLKIDEGFSCQVFAAVNCSLDRLPEGVVDLTLRSTTIVNMPNEIRTTGKVIIDNTPALAHVRRIEAKLLQISGNGLTTLPAINIERTARIDEPYATRFHKPSIARGTLKMYSPSPLFDFSGIRCASPLQAGRAMPYVFNLGSTKPADSSNSKEVNASLVQPVWNTTSIEGATLLDDGRLAFWRSRLTERGEVSGLSIGHVLDLPSNLLIRGDLIVTGATTPPHRIDMNVVVEGNVIIRGSGGSRPPPSEWQPVEPDLNTEERSGHGTLIVVHGDLDCRDADEPDLSLFDVKGTILLPSTSAPHEYARADSYPT